MQPDLIPPDDCPRMVAWVYRPGVVLDGYAKVSAVIVRCNSVEYEIEYMEDGVSRFEIEDAAAVNEVGYPVRWDGGGSPRMLL